MQLSTFAIVCYLSVIVATTWAQTVKPFPASSAILARYVGAYELGPGLVARIVLRGERLFSVSPLGTRTELIPESETTFVSKADGVRVAFAIDDNGTVTHLSVGSPPSEKAIRVVITADILVKYVGTYPLSPELSMTVTLEGDQLVVQATGQSKHPAYPESGIRFFVHDSDSDDMAQLEFGLGPEGTASFVVIRQGGHEQRVARK